MTRREFVERFQAIQKATQALTWSSVAVFFLFTVLTILPMVVLKVDGVIIKSTISAYAIVMVIFIGVSCGRWYRKLCCPHCEKSLFGRMGKVVYESGKCPHCGETVLHGP